MDWFPIFHDKGMLYIKSGIYYSDKVPQEYRTQLISNNADFTML